MPHDKAMQFGVQYRDMHTAIHNVLVLNHRDAAARLFEMLDVEVPMGEAQQQIVHEFGSEAKVVAVFEVNFRNPPTEYRNEPLNILNQSVIPDVY